jgi:hypothetical protein
LSLKDTPFGIVAKTRETNPTLIGTYPTAMERNSWLQYHRENAERMDTGVSYAAMNLIPDPLKK